MDSGQQRAGSPEAYRGVSFWLDTVPGALTPRAALGGDLDVDVCIVGAGYTGLWTAYYLRRADPHLRIAVVEAEIAGFGASGRNGGWCSALFASSHEKVAAAAGKDAAIALQRAMFETVDEVGKVAADEGIDCHFAKGGYLNLATNPAHVDRLRAKVDGFRALGFTEDDERWLSAEEARAHINAAGVLGAAYTPHCAAIHPARLARGLAEVVERASVPIYEHTPVLAIEPHRVSTSSGTVRADVIVRATEGFTPRLPGLKRAVVPIYSLMIATEPLPDAFWDEVGWAGRDTFNDGRNLIIYGQRTADGRIAFGGRGAPYHFGSRIRPAFDREPAVFADLHEVLKSLFPALGDARVTHTWGGPLGAPRDWFSSVGFDRGTGLAWAGGYVGDGVSTTNLAGRTLADLITGQATPLTRLPWVDHRSPAWEPEPLRWIGINALLKLPRGADRSESRTGHPARRRLDLLNRIVGH